MVVVVAAAARPNGGPEADRMDLETVVVVEWAGLMRIVMRWWELRWNKGIALPLTVG